MQRLEEELKSYLRVKHLFFTSNGTIALQIALKALRLSGEIITTPFSYVATTNSILWENCTPVFADIDPNDLNISPTALTDLITDKTRAILATHVYGHPCAVEEIENIALRHDLRVIYDGAHAFGAKYMDSSVLSFGDIATCSFHATKIFHTVEGGAVITNDDELAERIMLCRQFGHIGDEYYNVGINGKNSEIHAAMGLSILPQMDEIIKERMKLSDAYDRYLDGVGLCKPKARQGTLYNFAYYPIIFESEEQLLRSKDYLSNCGIYTRRYFYPSLNRLPFLEGQCCPVSESVSSRVLALPLYVGLKEGQIGMICDYLQKSLR